MSIPILMTASIDTRGMKGAMFEVKDRERMYVDTLNYYIDLFSKLKEEISLVFAENSGWDELSVKKQLIKSEIVQVEYLNLGTEDFDQTKGKSYNEMLLIDKAVMRSESVRNAGCFFKVTGRFPILNVDKLRREVGASGESFRFYADCKDHNVYEWLHLPINGHAGECRYWAASVEFYKQELMGRYNELNDYEGRNVEWFFLQLIRRVKHERGVHIRFRTQAHLTGVGGHSLGKGLSFFYSTDNDSAIMKLKRGIRQLLRWLVPWWCC